MTKISFSD